VTTKCDRAGCPRPALAHITGANLPGGADVCGQHYDQVFASAGVPRTARLIEDDGQDALFDLPGDGRNG